MYSEVDTEELKRDFREHLDKASETVNSWPSWKQSVLGTALGESECASFCTSVSDEEVGQPTVAEE
jgi:hypothetical protein